MFRLNERLNMQNNNELVFLKALNVVEKSNSFEMKFAPVMDEKLLSFTQVWIRHLAIFAFFNLFKAWKLAFF